MVGALSNRRNWHTRASLLPFRWRSEWQRCWSPAQSLAGLIAKYHPRLQIDNRAKGGAKFANIANQLAALGDQHFDAILVLGGGKNVIRLTGQKALVHAVLRTAQLARIHGKFVVIMLSGNAGNASFFVASLSWLMSRRSRNLHTLVRIAGSDNGAPYVNLYKEKAEDPFAQRADELNAKDGTTKYWAAAWSKSLVELMLKEIGLAIEMAWNALRTNKSRCVTRYEPCRHSGFAVQGCQMR